MRLADEARPHGVASMLDNNPRTHRSTLRPLVNRVLTAATLVAGIVTFGPAPVSANSQTCAGTGSPMARIGNSVFDDANDNAIFDAGETGLDGLVVELWLDVDDDAIFEPTADDGATPVCTVTTSGGGHYWFYDVDPDQYFVVIPTAPVGYQSSTGTTATAGVDNVDAGSPAGSFASVSPLVDLTISLPSAETAPDGVTDDEAAAEAATSPATFPDNASDLTIDFGFTPVPCLGIGNRMWFDDDGDGTHDAGEPGIDDVTAQLYAADMTGVPVGGVIETVTTSDGGYYLFACHAEGDYVVVVPSSNFSSGAALAGLVSTIDGSAGTDRQDDGLNPSSPGDQVMSRMTTLVDNGQPIAEADKPTGTAWSFDSPSDLANNTTIDFGFVDYAPTPPVVSSLGDFVWVDADRDGIQDPGESPVAGVTLLLLDSAGSQLATTVTSASGGYSFDGLTAGTYSVCFVTSTLPPGLVATASGRGGNDALDSDFDTTNCTDPVTLASGTNLVTLDLGVTTSNVDLAVTKTGTWSATSENITWSIAVRNIGTEADPGSIIVTDILPTGLGTPTVTAPSGVACNYDTATRAITCTSTSPLPAGASLALSVVTARTNVDVCSVSNTATVRGTGVDATTANNVATATVSTNCLTGSTTTPTLPNTGGTVILVTFAGILATAGYQLLRLADRSTNQ